MSKVRKVDQKCLVVHVLGSGGVVAVVRRLSPAFSLEMNAACAGRTSAFRGYEHSEAGDGWTTHRCVSAVDRHLVSEYRLLQTCAIFAVLSLNCSVFGV